MLIPAVLMVRISSSSSYKSFTIRWLKCFLGVDIYVVGCGVCESVRNVVKLYTEDTLVNFLWWFG